ncbi:MAG: VWA domain-containing protein [Pirellulaceae bacterium]|nr:VWA domain-containing protein [Pirellulaceae bacterium]
MINSQPNCERHSASRRFFAARSIPHSIPLVAPLVGFILFLACCAGLQGGQNIVVVLDDSGSMRQQIRMGGTRISRIQAAKNALSKVIQGLPDDAQLGILLLNNVGNKNPWLVPLGPLSTSDAMPRIQQIRADGGTPLGSQMKVAADALLDLRQKQIYGEYRLLVITDGEATDAKLLAAYLPDILSRGLSLDVIGVDMADNHSLADRAHSYRRADDVASFEKALEEVFAESNTQTDERGANDFELIADLPDELAEQALVALASPKNSKIGIVKEPIFLNPNGPVSNSSPANSSPSTNVPPLPTTAPTTINTIVGFLSALPCCFTIVIVFILIAVFNQGKNRKKRP